MRTVYENLCHTLRAAKRALHAASRLPEKPGRRRRRRRCCRQDAPTERVVESTDDGSFSVEAVTGRFMGARGWHSDVHIRLKYVRSWHQGSNPKKIHNRQLSSPCWQLPHHRPSCGAASPARTLSSETKGRYHEQGPHEQLAHRPLCERSGSCSTRPAGFHACLVEPRRQFTRCGSSRVATAHALRRFVCPLAG